MQMRFAEYYVYGDESGPMTKKGYLEEIKRIEVHQSNNPMDTSLRVVLKPNREEKLILPPGYIRDY